MTPQDVLQAFQDAREPPVAAMQAALANREEMLPAFLREFARAAELPPDQLPYDNAYGIMVEILGEWADPRSYGPIVAFLRLEWDTLEELLGDGISDSVHHVLAAVATEDFTPLRDLILDADAYMFTRSQAVTALIGIGIAQPHRRADVSALIREIGAKLELEADEVIVAEWVAAVALFGVEDQMARARAAVRSLPREITPLTPEEFEQILGQDLDDLSVPWLAHSYVFPPRIDALANVSRWHWLSDEEWAMEEAAINDLPAEDSLWLDRAERMAVPDVVLNPYRHVGRNDPCPCGSGKKYKKCCLA